MPWYKGNLHMHSFWSDGSDFPEMIADWFKCHGYDFIAFTEHDCFQVGEKWVTVDPDTYEGRPLAHTDCIDRYRRRFGDDWVETRQKDGLTQVRLKAVDDYRGLLEEPGGFRIFQGEEVTLDNGDGEPIYLNVYNHQSPVGLQAMRCSKAAAAEKIGRAVNAAAQSTGRPTFASFNHPNWGNFRVTAEDILAAPAIRFMEMFTALSSCTVYGDPWHVSTTRMWDIVLTQRIGEMPQDLVYGLATDDCHFYSEQEPLVIERRSLPGGGLGGPGRAWVMVHADSLTDGAVFSAIMGGRFYCSTGVTLRELEEDGGGIRIEIEADDGVQYITRFIGTMAGYDPSSEPVTDASGAPLRATRRYSEDVGRVLAESTGPTARYDFTTDELYVRAEITSDRPHPQPHRPGDTQCAWTQPVRPNTMN